MSDERSYIIFKSRVDNKEDENQSTPVSQY